LLRKRFWESQLIFVEIYLLQFGAESVVFYSEERRVARLVEADDEISESAKEDGALSRRIERMWRALWARTQRIEIGKTERMMRLRNWLQKFNAPDESLLQRLRATDRITLFYPAAMSMDEANAAWRAYLSGRERHHLFRLAANVLILPLTLLLTPLPGPNIIGYWFAYRAVCHYLVARGARRALAERKIAVRFEPSDKLSGVCEDSSGEHLADVATHFDLPNLTQFIKRISAQSETKPASLLIVL
jgi:hypothetical protein